MGLRLGAHGQAFFKRLLLPALLERVDGLQAGRRLGTRLPWLGRRSGRCRRLGSGRLLLLLFLLLLDRLLGGDQRLLLPLFVVGIAHGRVIATLLLGLRLERLPDHWRLRVFLRRELAEHRLAARAVDPYPADSWWSDERDL